MLRQQQSTHTCYVFAHQENSSFPAVLAGNRSHCSLRPEFPIPRLMSPPLPQLWLFVVHFCTQRSTEPKRFWDVQPERDTHRDKANIVLPRKATEKWGVVEVFPYRVTARPQPQHKAAASLAHAGESRAVGPPEQKCWAPPEPRSIRIQLHAPYSGEETAANSSSGVFKRKKYIYIYLCVTGQNPILKGF